MSGSGDTVDLQAPLAAGTDYRVLVYAGGGSYDLGNDYDASYPYTSADVDITAGYRDGSARTSDAYGVNDITAILPLPPPSNISANANAENEISVDWDEVSGAAGYYLYRAESPGSTKSDYTQIADVSSPPYTDTGLEDGEKYYYRVTSHD